MSENLMEAVACPSCGADFTIYPCHTVNVTVTPDSKQAVLSGALFQFTCPHCAAVFSREFPCFYHDMEKRIMVYLNADREKASPSFPLAALLQKEGYRFRRVFSCRDFVEKVNLLDRGLHDKSIQLCKAFCLPNVHSSFPEEQVDALQVSFPDKEPERLHLQVISQNKVIHHISIPLSVYDDLEKMAGLLYDAEPADGSFPVVEQDWINSPEGAQILHRLSIRKEPEPSNQAPPAPGKPRLPQGDMQPAFCRKCGFTLLSDSTFCSRCGTPVQV